MEDREARMGLCAARSAGDVGLSRLVREQGAVEVWEYLRRCDPTTSLAAKAHAVNLAEVESQTRACGARFIVPSDVEWPTQVNDLAWTQGVGRFGGEPLGLWVSGETGVSDACRLSISMVGARASTAYGEHVTSDLAFGLAERGYTVISGGAYGIDACAHRGAISAGGMSLAIMAGGLEEFYPAGNAALIRRVQETGLVISEFAPSHAPSRTAFLIRNRLIAALSQATVIVEGAVRSGAQNTVSWALSLGRPVMAVPGPVTSVMSATPHRLIRDGEAVLAATVGDIVAAVQPMDALAEKRERESPSAEDGLPVEDAHILDALPKRKVIGMDDLCSITGESVLGLMVILARLKDGGFAQEVMPGLWRSVASRRAEK